MGYRHLLYHSPYLDSLAHDSGVKSLDLFKINCKNLNTAVIFSFWVAGRRSSIPSSLTRRCGCLEGVAVLEKICGKGGKIQ
jgi:hypothetical protein